MLHTKFQVNWPFCSGEEVKIDFKRPLWQPSWISNRTILAIFIHQSPSFESIGLSVQEKMRKINCQDGGHGSHLGFSTGTILAIFDLQVTPYASYQVSRQLAQVCRRSRLLKQLLTPCNRRPTLTDHNSSTSALRAQVS